MSATRASSRTLVLITCVGAALALTACGGGSGAPSTPELIGVLDGECAEIPAGTTGGFRVLPRQDVRLRVAAAWPSADLVVKANGTELEKVGPSDTGLQSKLRAEGTGFWVPEEINPNPTPPVWTVAADLPQGMRTGPVTLELTSRTPGGASSSALTVSFIKDMSAESTAPNRVKLEWRDRGDELGYDIARSDRGGPYTPLVSIGMNGTSYTDSEVKGNRLYSYRLTAQGCGPPGSSKTGTSLSTTAVTTMKETGEEEIRLFRSNLPGDDQFDYINPLLLFMPEDAEIRSVTNVSMSSREKSEVPLENVRHTDAKVGKRSLTGSGCPTGALRPGESTTKFNGQLVQGEWKVRACANAVFLEPPARIALKVSWTQ
jgi:hypothetical protein